MSDPVDVFEAFVDDFVEALKRLRVRGVAPGALEDSGVRRALRSCQATAHGEVEFAEARVETARLPLQAARLRAQD